MPQKVNWFLELQGSYMKQDLKNKGIFKDFPAPNNFIPGPFYFHWKCFEHSNAKMGIAQTRYTVKFRTLYKIIQLK